MKVDLDSINLEKTAQFIHILAVIDTHYVKAHYPNPSRNASAPTAITSNAAFMLSSRLPGVSSSEGTGTLGLKLQVHDSVSLMGTSLSDNSGDAAVIYDVRHFSGIGSSAGLPCTTSSRPTHRALRRRPTSSRSRRNPRRFKASMP